MDHQRLPVRVYSDVVRLKRAGIDANVEFDGDKRWTLTMEHEDMLAGDHFKIIHKRRRSGRIATTFDLVLDGEKQNVKNLIQALLRMMGTKKSSGGTSAVSGVAGAARTTSTEVRQASVYRV